MSETNVSAGTSSSDEHVAAHTPPWVALLERLQDELNALSSVAIEVPELRPYAESLRKALG